MSMSDPIADLLTRIRNGNRVGRATVDLPASNIKLEICRVLKEEGFINDVEYSDATKPAMMRIKLKYLADRTPVLHDLKRVSKPSLRTYRGSKNLEQVRSGLGLAIVTTSKGVMTEKQARKENVGGEVLCHVW